ncbi:LytR C-terminal domain-containing protein [Rarobacter incanus]|uniref:LytR C-terminal domain-containing protein n=1 Tax=Rarobacter incanus TaxID=153494 RepID=UPI001476E23C|nr:LytR C-terminal domain-containing protein [Rarobacter incanus]
MTKEYQYPADEFDVASVDGGPQGAHRAKPSRAKAWIVALIVLVLAGGLGYAAATYGPSLLGLTSEEIADTVGIESQTVTSSATTSAATDSASTAATQGGTDASTDADAGKDAAADASQDKDATKDEANDEAGSDAASAQATVDKSTAVRVLNATSTKGLAAGATTKLKAAGWSSLTATNYKGNAVSASVVYFKTDADEANAKSVAKTLGISKTLKVPALTGSVSAILASDYRN